MRASDLLPDTEPVNNRPGKLIPWEDAHAKITANNPAVSKLLDDQSARISAAGDLLPDTEPVARTDVYPDDCEAEIAMAQRASDVIYEREGVAISLTTIIYAIRAAFAPA